VFSLSLNTWRREAGLLHNLVLSYSTCSGGGGAPSLPSMVYENMSGCMFVRTPGSGKGAACYA
jgi:hypothetical protein